MAYPPKECPNRSGEHQPHDWQLADTEERYRCSGAGQYDEDPPAPLEPRRDYMAERLAEQMLETGLADGSIVRLEAPTERYPVGSVCPLHQQVHSGDQGWYVHVPADTVLPHDEPRSESVIQEFASSIKVDPEAVGQSAIAPGTILPEGFDVEYTAESHRVDTEYVQALVQQALTLAEMANGVRAGGPHIKVGVQAYGKHTAPVEHCLEKAATDLERAAAMLRSERLACLGWTLG